MQVSWKRATGWSALTFIFHPSVVVSGGGKLHPSLRHCSLRPRAHTARAPLRSPSLPRCVFSSVRKKLHQGLNFCRAAGCTTHSFHSVFLNCSVYAPTGFSFFSFFNFFPNECCFLPCFIRRSNQRGLSLIFRFSKSPGSGLAASPMHSRQPRRCGTWGEDARTLGEQRDGGTRAHPPNTGLQKNQVNPLSCTKTWQFMAAEGSCQHQAQGRGNVMLTLISPCTIFWLPGKHPPFSTFFSPVQVPPPFG